MTSGQIKRGNEIQNLLTDLYEHKDRIEKCLQGLAVRKEKGDNHQMGNQGRVEIRTWHSSSSNYFEELVQEFLPMPLDIMLQLYKMNVANKIDKLEKEFISL